MVGVDSKTRQIVQDVVGVGVTFRPHVFAYCGTGRGSRRRPLLSPV